ncbi:MAG: DUF362 domain-containing protein [Candidatus Helarchaeota archaeon]|nr:DUF362 domain-containing protein [Candidatus Helarchaeota archaeon]
MKAELEFEKSVIIADVVHSKEEFISFMREIDIKPPFIVKPNWISEDYGHFTDPKVLIWLLEFLNKKGQVILTESYSVRNTIKCPAINTKRMTEQDLKRIRSTEEEFLTCTGISPVLQELNIEYVNVAEEVLKERIADPDIVRKKVTSSYEPVSRPELYSFVPEKLYKLRQGTLISLARFKIFFSMCVKNMFGMIPEYVGYGARFRYHGRADKYLALNIVDINKVYRSLFKVVGIVEGIHTLTCNMKGIHKPYRTLYGEKYFVSENNGLIYYGNDPLWLDAFIHQQCGKDPSKTEHLSKAASSFGKWPSKLLEAAQQMPNPLKLVK